MECRNKLLIVANDRVHDLHKLGLNISLTSFKDFKNMVEIGFTGQEEKKFMLSCKGEMFFLENPEYMATGGRPTFMLEDMIDYLLVLTNGGQIIGKLMLPGEEEKRFSKEAIVVPT